MGKKNMWHVVGHVHDQNGRYIACVDDQTFASSEKKAINNVLFRWKKHHDVPVWHKYRFDPRSVREI